MEKTSESTVQGAEGDKRVGGSSGQCGGTNVSGVSRGTKNNRGNRRNAGTSGKEYGLGQSEGDVDNAAELAETEREEELEQLPKDYSITDISGIEKLVDKLSNVLYDRAYQLDFSADAIKAPILTNTRNSSLVMGFEDALAVSKSSVNELLNTLRDAKFANLSSSSSELFGALESLFLKLSSINNI